MAQIREIVLASGNPGKVREITASLAPLGVEVVAIDRIDPDGRIRPPDEDGLTFAENARAKADYYARATGRLALADDSGLVVDALGGAPGVRSARFAEDDFPPQATRKDIDKANNEKLLRELARVGEDERTARFVCCLALSDGAETLIETTGEVAGRIVRQPSGNNGFGYDPLFFIPELGCTAAELAPEKKNEISHRGKAVRKFAAILKAMLER